MLINLESILFDVRYERWSFDHDTKLRHSVPEILLAKVPYRLSINIILNLLPVVSERLLVHVGDLRNVRVFSLQLLQTMLHSCHLPSCCARFHGSILIDGLCKSCRIFEFADPFCRSGVWNALLVWFILNLHGIHLVQDG